MDIKPIEAQAISAGRAAWLRWRVPLCALVLGFLLGIGVAHAAPPSAVLTWAAPTLNTDGTAITLPLTYNVYQGAQGSTTKPSVLTGVTALTATITTGLAASSTVCFELTAVAGGQESAHSGEACKTFPAATPAAPTLTVK